MFSIGEKIVCINHIRLKKVDIARGVKAPIKGEIYTIREFDSDTTDEIAILVNEVVNPKFQYSNGFGEATFYLHHFRKLDYDFAENLLKEITEQVKKETMLDLTTI